MNCFLDSCLFRSLTHSLMYIIPLQNAKSKNCIQFDRLGRSSYPEVFLVKGVLKICRTFTEEHPCQSVNSIKMQSNFIEITLQHGCSPVNFLHIFRTLFTKNTSAELLLDRYSNTILRFSTAQQTLSRTLDMVPYFSVKKCFSVNDPVQEFS